jgi:hypothetical protein
MAQLEAAFPIFNSISRCLLRSISPRLLIQAARISSRKYNKNNSLWRVFFTLHAAAGLAELKAIKSMKIFMAESPIWLRASSRKIFQR